MVGTEEAGRERGVAQSSSFAALVLREEGGTVRAGMEMLSPDALPEDEVLISVEYSSLNYKDGLALSGRGRVVRSYPMVPGIDLAGTVRTSRSPDWKQGDRVILTGWGLGEQHWGGYAELAASKAGWLVRLPDQLTPRQAMGMGTAGLTAMLAIMTLQDRGLSPDGGEVVVSGAAGGVGSLAVAILANLGFRVVASTGRTEAHGYLKDLGAGEIIDRAALASQSDKPLESGCWAGAVDTVGGDTLAGLLRSTRQAGSVASCGNAGGNALHTTVLPFILRGVSLLGIDSNYCPLERRRAAWDRLATDLPLVALGQIMTVAPLRDALELGQSILQGQVRGRIVVAVQEEA
jgi:acrylyl-CoA reductase (NADPH)